MILAPKEALVSVLNADNALEIGKAAEHLVCASIILSGHRCYLTDQGLPYDVIVDRDGFLIRVQVKATCFPKNMNMRGRAERIGYTFHVRRRGKNGSKRLNNDECDIVALVALDIQTIAYLPIGEVGQTVQFMPPGHSFRGRFKRTRGEAIDCFPFDDALERFLATGSKS